MTESTKTLLLVGGIAIVGYIIYTKLKPSTRGAPSTITAPGAGNSIPGATQNGSTTGQIGSILSGVGNDVNAVDNTFNSLYDFFGGNTNHSSNNPTPPTGGG